MKTYQVHKPIPWRLQRGNVLRGLLISVLIIMTSTHVNAEFRSEHELFDWLDKYYLAPDPDRFPDAIEYLSHSGMLDDSNAMAPLFGFTAGVFSDNSELVPGWLERLDALGADKLRVVVLGLWYANLPDSRSLTYQMLDRHPTLNEEYAFLRKGPPVSITKIPLSRGAWVLDSLWGNFMATGRAEPVERIIEALPWTDVDGDINRLLIGAAAQWSLVSNAVQHERVFEICKASIERQPEAIAEKLSEVLHKAALEQNKHSSQGNADLSHPLE